MKFSVEQIQEPRESFGPYRYRILKGDVEFAIISHNYRGECEGVRILSTGREEDLPFGMSSEFLTGGGPYPLDLSSAAKKYLEGLQ